MVRSVLHLVFKVHLEFHLTFWECRRKICLVEEEKKNAVGVECVWGLSCHNIVQEAVLLGKPWLVLRVNHEDDGIGCRIIEFLEIGVRVVRIAPFLYRHGHLVVDDLLAHAALRRHVRMVLMLRFTLYQKIENSTLSARAVPEEEDLRLEVLGRFGLKFACEHGHHPALLAQLLLFHLL